MDFIGLLKEFSIPIVILLVFFGFAWVFNVLFERFIHLKARKGNFDPTNYNFLRHFVSASIYLVGIGFAVYSIPALRALATSILAGAGILAVAIGFASQEALSNIISGMFIVIYKPFGIHDRIEFKGMVGVVEDISLRHTVIRNYENKRIVVPNSMISSDIIINSDLNEEQICRHISFSISYESDVKLAKQLIQEEALKHPLCIDARTEEQKELNEDSVIVRLVALNESSVDLKAWVWAKNQAESFVLQCDLLESVKARFKENAIEIPYPHRTIVQKS
ncbi:MAG: mechanosensitive ion channel family protein [Chitinophagales bacterium]